MISRRSFVEKLFFSSSGAVVLSSLVGGLVRQARGATGGKKRVVFLVQGNSFNANQCYVKAGAPLAYHETTQFAWPESLAPLAPHRGKMLLLDGLVNTESWSTTPNVHTSFYAALTCMKAAAPSGISIDQYLAGTMGSASPFKSVLLGNVRDPKATLVNHSLCASAPGRSLPLQCSAREAFSSLFGGGSGSMTSAGADAARLASLKRKSLLDFMLDDVKRAQTALSAPEREKLDEYLGSIRGLEVRRVKLEEQALKAGASCGQAPALLNATLYEDRLEAQFEVATLALVCGLTQVVVISSGTGNHFPQAYRKLFATGTESHEDWGHKPSVPEGIAKYNKVNQLHAGCIARMASKLAATPEGDGSVLDSSAIVWLNDGGAEHHSNRHRVPAVVVGNAGGYLGSNGRYVKYPFRPDTYVASPPNYRSLADFYVTLTHAAGAPNDSFGKGGLEAVKGVLREIVA